MELEMDFTNTVEVFPEPGGWHYAIVPDDIRAALSLGTINNWGQIPVTATVGATTWKTSLMPKGDGRHIIALAKNLRAAENINLGEDVSITLQPRPA